MSCGPAKSHGVRTPFSNGSIASPTHSETIGKGVPPGSWRSPTRRRTHSHHPAPGRCALLGARQLRPPFRLVGEERQLLLQAVGPLAQALHEPRTREYVEIVRRAMSRERLAYDGEPWTLPSD
ncbi:hypothetical protein ACF053_01855 [Streptomyces kanasensis]|uniref:hypothetical protein n=1 Tax=Streptomyces kanasensis TaxID=936756 RepID=UPI0037004B5E